MVCSRPHWLLLLHLTFFFGMLVLGVSNRKLKSRYTLASDNNDRSLSSSSHFPRQRIFQKKSLLCCSKTRTMYCCRVSRCERVRRQKDYECSGWCKQEIRDLSRSHQVEAADFATVAHEMLLKVGPEPVSAEQGRFRFFFLFSSLLPFLTLFFFCFWLHHKYDSSRKLVQVYFHSLLINLLYPCYPKPAIMSCTTNSSSVYWSPYQERLEKTKGHPSYMNVKRLRFIRGKQTYHGKQSSEDFDFFGQLGVIVLPVEFHGSLANHASHG